MTQCSHYCRRLLWIPLLLATSFTHAGNINFFARSEITASPFHLQAAVTLTLNAAEPVYNVQVWATAYPAEKRRVAAAELWKPREQKTVTFAMPSDHPLPGQYNLLLEIAFRDQAGAALSTALAINYHLADRAFHAPYAVRISGARIHWNTAQPRPADGRLQLAATPLWQTDRQTYPAETTSFTLTRGTLPIQARWRYPQLAILHWSRNGRHFSQPVPWSILTDGNGKRLTEYTPEDEQQRPFGDTAFSSSATLTARPDRLDGRIRIVLESPFALRRATVLLHAREQTLPLGEVLSWQPGEARDFAVHLAADHSLPGRYHLLLTILFQDLKDIWQSLPLGIDYSVNAAAQPPAHPGLEITGQQLLWDTDLLPPATITAAVTTSPAWRQPRQPLTPEITRLQIEPLPAVTILPNRRYQQLLRLDHWQAGTHFSRVLPWTITTDARGQWIGITASHKAAIPPKPFWRNTTLLIITAILIAVAAFLGGLRRHSRRQS